MKFTADDLVELEERYSGGLTHVGRRVVSPHDPRGPDVRKMRGCMCSGGRMGHKQHYAERYAEELSRIDLESRLVIVELGVLLGVGLAMWCDVFPRARIIGLDVDPGRFAGDVLYDRGAFRENRPEVCFFDELANDRFHVLEKILGGEKIDIFIDDALHNDDSILKMADTAKTFLADRCLYVVEDNSTVAPRIGDILTGFQVRRDGQLTVCRR